MGANGDYPFNTFTENLSFVATLGGRYYSHMEADLLHSQCARTVSERYANQYRSVDHYDRSDRNICIQKRASRGVGLSSESNTIPKFKLARMEPR